ncbi:MAG TPA: hypothetical protein VMH86_09360 [Rhizomicrobium sp.]|nr:hypothetical protein [Rhizomicrobium sp.]
MQARRWLWAVMIATAVALPLAMFAAWKYGLAASGPPEVLDAADRDWPGVDGESDRLTRELGRRFPPGTPVASMKSAMLAQGFRDVAREAPCWITGGAKAGRDPAACKQPPANSLSYRWNDVACSNFVTVTWMAGAGGRIVRIAGRVGLRCL